VQIRLVAVITIIGALWLKAKAIWAAVSKIVSPLCEEAEQLAKDGKIDKADRKIFVMKALDLLIMQKKIKINFIGRIIISKVVDYVAEKLPDINISQEAQGIIARLIQK
jgi:hypothetical protein